MSEWAELASFFFFSFSFSYLRSSYPWVVGSGVENRHLYVKHKRPVLLCLFRLCLALFWYKPCCSEIRDNQCVCNWFQVWLIKENSACSFAFKVLQEMTHQPKAPELLAHFKPLTLSPMRVCNCQEVLGVNAPMHGALMRGEVTAL